MTVFEGVIPTVVTPWNSGEELDEQEFRKELRYMLSQNPHGLCVGGSTGEGFTFSTEELERVTGIAVDEVGGRIPVIAGVIRDSTREVIEYGKVARSAGASGLQVTPVHYLYHSGPESVVRYYDDIGQATDLPLVVYNVVKWNILEPSTLVQLDDVDRVVGVKQSAGDIHRLADLLKLLQEQQRELRVLSAVDALLYPTFAMGAHGSIAGISAVVPGLVLELWSATQDGDHARALELHRHLLGIWRAIEGPEAPGRIRAALRMLGRHDGAPRRPLAPAEPAAERAVRRALAAAGLVEDRA